MSRNTALRTGCAMLAVLGISAAAFGQPPSQTIQVQIQVEQYAELTVDPAQDTIILHLEDIDGVPRLAGSSNDGPNGQPALLTLQANYLTKLVVTSGSGLMQEGATGQNHWMALTADNGNLLGAWPWVATVGNYAAPASPTNMFGWNSNTQEAVMSALHPSNAGSGIPAGTHQIALGVSSQMDRTETGAWAAAGVYHGTLLITVMPN